MERMVRKVVRQYPINHKNLKNPGSNIYSLYPTAIALGSGSWPRSFDKRSDSKHSPDVSGEPVAITKPRGLRREVDAIRHFLKIVTYKAIFQAA